MILCVVHGCGDIGSAVAHRLFRAGCRVALVDHPAPAWLRRGRAFTDALFDRTSRLDGVEARLAADLDELERLLAAGGFVGITTADPASVLRRLRPDALVDARMRKREIPEVQRGLAPLTIGLGPNFVAGETTDRVVETAWGPALGAVIESGPSLPFTGEPRLIAGIGRERYVRSPAAGALCSASSLGEPIARGAELARVGEILLRAPHDGVLVGLARPGVSVAPGAKVAEVDPRRDRGLAFGIGERAGAIARGVLSLVAGRFSIA